MDKGRDKIALLCDSRLRPALADMLYRAVPNLPVAAYDEIVLGTEVLPVETVSVDQQQLSPSNNRQLVGVAS